MTNKIKRKRQELFICGFCGSSNINKIDEIYTCLSCKAIYGYTCDLCGHKLWYSNDNIVCRSCGNNGEIKKVSSI